MKSDTEGDWAECHYDDKTDKYEPTHNCNSTKYDNLFREDPKQNTLRELKQQHYLLMQKKISAPSMIEAQLVQIGPTLPKGRK